MIALSVLAVLAPPVALLVVLLLGVDALQRRRAAVIARQIAVTDAIHREFGAVVAPFVSRVRGGWRVVLPMEAWHPDAARIVELAARMFESDGPVEVAVVAPWAATRRAPAAQNRERIASAMSA